MPFDRDKLARSVEIALRKRNVEPERIEQTVSKIVQELESLGESEVTSETIGESVMAHLRELDDVAYVRFASVYRNFREAKDFETALAELAGDEEPPKASRVEEMISGRAGMPPEIVTVLDKLVDEWPLRASRTKRRIDLFRNTVIGVSASAT